MIRCELASKEWGGRTGFLAAGLAWIALAGSAAAQANVFSTPGTFSIDDATFAGDRIVLFNSGVTVNLLDGGIIGTDGLDSVAVFAGTFQMFGGETVGGRVAVIGASSALIERGELGQTTAFINGDSLVTFETAAGSPFVEIDVDEQDDVTVSGFVATVGGQIDIHGGVFLFNPLVDVSAVAFGGTIRIFRGSFASSVGAQGTGTLVLLGGSVGQDSAGDSVFSFDSAHVEVRGGSFSGAIVAFGSSVIDVHGCLELEGGVLTGILEDGTPICVPAQAFDSAQINLISTGDLDADGLCDQLEPTFGTDPENPDTDDDGLLDGVEVDIAEGTGCPSPLVADSDGDGLLDGVEVGTVGSDPCNADTDEDGIPDDIDPLPLDPGGTAAAVEEGLRDLCLVVKSLDLSLIDAPNANAAKGRRNALCNKLNAAANAVADGDYASAIDQLTSLLAKLDGDPTPPDWVVDSAEKSGIRAQTELLVEVLQFL